jgi:hypothetical protein
MSDEENVPDLGDDVAVPPPEPDPGFPPEQEVAQIQPLNEDEGQDPYEGRDDVKQDDGSEDDPFEEEVG